MFEAGKAQRKEQIVYEINKIASMMHTLIFADGALGAKNAPHCSQKQYFEEGMERTNSDRNGQKSEKSKSMTKNALIEAVWGSKKWNFQLKVHEIVLQNCAPRRGRNNIFENM